MARRWLRRALPILITAVVVGPVAAYAFNDVPSDSPHAAGIAYVDGAGITHGCDSSGNYCPDNPVTRGQMATFLYRASGNDPATAPSVNAAKVGGKTASQLQGFSGYVTRNDHITQASVSGFTEDLVCPTVGQQVLSGGGTPASHFFLSGSYPGTGGDWIVVWAADDGANHPFDATAYVICANVS